MEQFLTNKYSRIYFLIINRAKDRFTDEYTETHHIIPRSIGGSNLKSNLVELTAREHFICHLLLPHMVSRSDQKAKLYHAMGRMVTGNKHGRKYNSFQYSLARKYHSLGNTISQTGKKMNLSQEERKRRSDFLRIARTKRTYSSLSEETKQKISDKRKGKPAHNKGKSAQIYICPHCKQSIGGASNFSRWHGDNCRSLNLSS